MELHGKDLPPEVLARLHRLFASVTDELRRSLSPPLAAELGQLIGSVGNEPDPAQVRIEYASLLGWLGGLVIGMLGELEAAARYGPLLHKPLTGGSAGHHAA